MPAPTTILVHVDESEPPIVCGSIEQMDDVLDRLHTAELSRKSAGGDERCPLSVGIAIPGNFIYVGLGTDQSFLMLGAKDEWHYAIGDEKAVGDPVMFYGVGQDSYWSPKHLIPVEAARSAIRYFVENQQRSPSLKWEY